MPINGARGRGGHSAYPWHAPATRRLVAWFPGLLWEVLPGALGGQVRCITSAPTTQGDGGNPQVPPGKPPGAHPNSPGKQLQPVETTWHSHRPLLRPAFTGPPIRAVRWTSALQGYRGPGSAPHTLRGLPAPPITRKRTRVQWSGERERTTLKLVKSQNVEGSTIHSCRLVET